MNDFAKAKFQEALNQVARISHLVGELQASADTESAQLTGNHPHVRSSEALSEGKPGTPTPGADAPGSLPVPVAVAGMAGGCTAQLDRLSDMVCNIASYVQVGDRLPLSGCFLQESYPVERSTTLRSRVRCERQCQL